MALQLNGTDGVTFNDGSEQWAAASPLGTKNLIINGDMNIAQRGTSATGVGPSTVGYLTLDRFRIQKAGTPTAAFTMTQNADAPSGFSNCMKLEVTTADASVASSTLQYIDQFIEAQNLQHLAYGTSDAKTITLSFYVKCSTAQTFAVDLVNEDNSRYYNTTYSISSANTWERKTITFNGDTSSGFNNDNGRGLRVRWTLVAGSNYTDGSIDTSWNNTDDRATDHENTWVGSTGQTWQITGVQLEVGDTATPFEVMPYDMQLARCQRYYNRIYDIWGDQSVHVSGGRLMTRVDYPVQMRANPTVTTNTVSNTSCTFQGSNRTNTNGTHLYANSTTVTGDAFFVINNMESSAEL